MRENATSKAARYLAEASLTVLHVDRESVRASCRGDGTLYAVSWNRAEGWRCTGGTRWSATSAINKRRERTLLSSGDIG
jgi:hypothetical protein